jgi:hypothetical protein
MNNGRSSNKESLEKVIEILKFAIVKLLGKKYLRVPE